MEANLVVTYDPTHASKAQEEVKQLLEEKDVKFLQSEFEGVFLLHVKGDPKKAVKQLYDLCRNEPYRFKHTYRWVPVEKWCKTFVTDLERAVKEMEENIGYSETWKLDIGKRGFEGDTMELIMKLTDQITRPKVDLKNPQKIVKIEIVGGQTGVSLLEADEYLNVGRIKTE